MANAPYYTKTQVDSKVDPLTVDVENLNQDVFNLQLEVEGIADGTGGKGYATISDAMAVTPLPADGVLFTIDYDNESERGVYRYDSTVTPEGYVFVRPIDAAGVIEEGNTQAVSGGKIYELGVIKPEIKTVIADSENTEIGTITTDGTSNGPTNTRFRFNDYYKADLGAVAYAPIGWEVSIHRYDENKNQIENTGWQSTPYNIEKAPFIRVKYKKQDDSIITILDITSDFYLTTEYFINQINNLENQTNNLENQINRITDYDLIKSKIIGIEPEFEEGSISNTTGENTSLVGRIRTDYIEVNGYSLSFQNYDETEVQGYHLFYYDKNGVFIKRVTQNWIFNSIIEDYSFVGKIRVVFLVDIENANLFKMLIASKSIERGYLGFYKKIKPYNIGNIWFESGTLNSSDGQPSAINTRVRTVLFYDVDGFKIKNNNLDFDISILRYNEDENYINGTGWLNQEEYVDDFKGKIKLVVRKSTGGTITVNDSFDIEMYVGKTETPLSPAPAKHYNNSFKRKFIAHRGAYFGDIVPENTIHSVVMAKRMGYKIVECDVKKTADGHYVVMHDNSINRTMRNADYTPISGTINVADKTLEELKSDYVFISSTPKFRTQILTVQEYVKYCRDLGITVMFDIKIPDFEYLDDIVKIVGDDFICFSTQKPVLQYARSISKCLCLLNSSSTSGVIDFLDNLGGWCGFSTTNPNVLTEEFISELKEKGYESQASIFSKNNEVEVLKNGATMLLSDYSINVSKPYITEEIYSDDNEFSDFSTTGIITNGVVMLENGQVLSKTFSEQILYGGLAADLFFKGSLSISINGNAYATISSEDLDLRHFSMRFRNATPSIQITALQNSEIHFLNLKTSTF